MSSPFSVFFHDLRLQSGLRQQELAERIGYEQAYVSAVELGKKNPSEEFLRRLVNSLALSEQDQDALWQSVKESQRKYVLPVEVSTDTYRLCFELWSQIDRLRPAQIRLIREVLRIYDQGGGQERNPNRRIHRRVKEKTEAEM